MHIKFKSFICFAFLMPVLLACSGRIDKAEVDRNFQKFISMDSSARSLIDYGDKNGFEDIQFIRGVAIAKNDHEKEHLTGSLYASFKKLNENIGVDLLYVRMAEFRWLVPYSCGDYYCNVYYRLKSKVGRSEAAACDYPITFQGEFGYCSAAENNDWEMGYILQRK